MAKVGIIGGSGLYNIEGIETVGDQMFLDTPFGQPSDSDSRLRRCRQAGQRRCPRPGADHGRCPHHPKARRNAHCFGH